MTAKSVPGTSAKPDRKRREASRVDGKKPARKAPKNRTPAQLDRQFKAFSMHIAGKTHREIMAELGIGSPKVVVADIRAESELRAKEREAFRDTDREQQLARLDSLYRDAAGHFSQPGTSALPTAAKVLELRAKLLGLDAPLEVNVTVDALMEAFDAR